MTKTIHGLRWILLEQVQISEKTLLVPELYGLVRSHQVLRSDGAYNYSKTVDDFQELDPQSDMLSTVIPAPDGIAWVGSNQGLFKLDANNDTYQFFSPGNSTIPG